MFRYSLFALFLTISTSFLLFLTSPTYAHDGQPHPSIFEPPLDGHIDSDTLAVLNGEMDASSIVPTVYERDWYVDNWQLTEDDWESWARFLVGSEPLSATPRAIAAPKLNLASGQTAIQSSTAYGGDAGRAVDSNINGAYNNNSVTHTQSENQPWLQIDLKNTYALDSIWLVNRTDCCADRLANFHILVSNNDMRGKSLSQLLSDSTVWSLHERGVVGRSRTYATPTTGRFVRVQLQGQGVLSLADVQVYGQNLAQGKSASQSSTGWGGRANRAVDGDIDGVYNNGSVSSTTDSAFPWWQLDLGASHNLGRIWLFNRTDCCQDRLAHFYVFASDSDMRGKTLDELQNDPDVWEYFEVAGVGNRYMVAAGDAKGRYLRIQRNTTGILSLAEVVVYGAPSNQISSERLNPAEFGEWSAPIEWPHISVHASLLPNGQLLTWDATPDDFTPVHDPHLSPNNTTRGTVWDPTTGLHRDAANENGVDLFCAGTNQLPDGRLFIAGGTTGYNASIHETTLYDHTDHTFTSGPNLEFARWYPTVTDLASGEMLVTGGRGLSPELYSPDTNSLRTFSGINLRNNYPIIRQAPNGNILYAGGDGNADIYTIDLNGNGALNPENLDAPLTSSSSHAIYDIGKALYAGGSAGARTAAVLDLDTMDVTPTTPMGYRRTRINLTILADGSVMAVGGHFEGGLCAEEASSYAGEIWNPDTGLWAVMASQDRPRHYHSTSVLLPDGRVWSGGGGYATTVSTQVAKCAYQNTSEIFSPPYLFNPDGSLATRPTIRSAPTTVSYNSQFTVQTPTANQIDKVGIVRLSSVTHKLNTGQRYVPLDYTVRNGDELRITTPRDTFEATEGYYMLFIMNENGTPSVAHMVHLGQSDGGPVTPPISPPPVNGEWEQLSGRLVQVSHGVDGSMWGVNQANSIYRRTDEGNGWQRVSTPNLTLAQVDAQNYDNAIGITTNGDIYYYSGSGWTQMQGELSHVSHGIDGSVWGVNENGIPWRRSGVDSGRWRSMPLSAAELIQIDALNYDRAIGVTASGEIYQYDGTGWSRVGGGLSHVSYGADGSIWGVNANNNVYRRPSIEPGAWERLDSITLKQIDGLSYSRAVGVDTDNLINRYK